MANPDAPLGHHIGQDVGHITSTVLGSSVQLGRTTLQASVFNGDEPEPTKVDLPLGEIDSYAARIVQQFSTKIFAMASMAYIKTPESHDPGLDHIWRYSASLYSKSECGHGWNFHNTLIWGLVNFYDDTAALTSFGDEFLLQKHAMGFWGRVEHLERTSGELQIANLPAGERRWVTAFTVGYTHQLTKFDGWTFGIGSSVTKDFLPREFESPYGGDPLTARVFLQAGGMQMWDF
jgi:hypothetical protein